MESLYWHSQLEEKMNPKEARQLWIDALRSGEYHQEQHVLSYNGAFCCLGVACELYQKEVGVYLLK